MLTQWLIRMLPTLSIEKINIRLPQRIQFPRTTVFEIIKNWKECFKSEKQIKVSRSVTELLRRKVIYNTDYFLLQKTWNNSISIENIWNDTEIKRLINILLLLWISDHWFTFPIYLKIPIAYSMRIFYFDDLQSMQGTKST